MQPNSRLRWTQFKRTTPSIFSSLSSITDAAGALPVDRVASLSNLNSHFIRNGTPPPVVQSRQLIYDATVAKVNAWSDSSQSTLPPHVSDGWRFTADAVKSQCTLQYTQTAPGPDTVLPVFLKYGGDSLWEALAAIYNFSWLHSVTPLAWREANVMALYKGEGDKASANSFRPISMTSIIVRTFEHLIHSKLVELLDPAIVDAASSSFSFAATQFGFRKERRTYDAIHYLLTGVQRIMKLEVNKKRIAAPVLFLDILKAFDRVDHSILLLRLHDAGITGLAWRWIRSFLTGRRMRTVDAAETSQWQSVEFGVPQGCVLSPLLFSIFIDPIVKAITDDAACRLVKPVFYADDGAIAPNPFAVPSTNKECAAYPAQYLLAMQTALGHLDSWCDSSRMKFGASKTRLVLFSSAHQPDTQPYSNLRLCDFTIDIAHHYTYLGVILDEGLRWTLHRKLAAQKARAASIRITRVCLRTKQIHLPSLRSFILSYLIPSFAYGLLFWGAHIDDTTRRKLQSLIATPLRVAYTLPRTTHQLSTLHLFGMPTVGSLLLKAELSHLHRLSSLPPSHPTRLVHDAATQAVTRSHNSPKPPHFLQPICALTLGLRISTDTAPRLFLTKATTSLRPLLPLDTAALITTSSAALQSPVPTKFWNKVSETARAAYGAKHYPLQLLKAVVQAANLPSLGQSLTPSVVHVLAAWSPVNEWRQQHKATNPNADHATACPLVDCTPWSTGLAPSFGHDRFRRDHETLPHSRRRARLLLGRSRTAEVRRNFKTKDEGDIDPLCTYPACAVPPNPSVAPSTDSIQHMLLHCPRHTAARQSLQYALSNNHQPPLPLSLNSILLASYPPAPFRRYEFRSLVSTSNDYLDQVEADRTAAGLPPLDTG